MKIVIVGAGISGLTTYLFLKKLLSDSPSFGSALEIVIFESHEIAERQKDTKSLAEEASPGVALGIGPNGLAVFQDLDETLFEEIVGLGYAVSHFHFMSARGWRLARFCTTNQDHPPLHTVLIGRARLWECLRNRVPKNAILSEKAVQEVGHSRDGKAWVKFTDESPDIEADLVIGADGVRSVVKKLVTGNGKDDHFPPVFEGFLGIGGIMSSSCLPTDEPWGRTTMIFGPHGFFGYGACTTHSASTGTAKRTAPRGPFVVWWSTYEADHPLDTRNFDKEEIRQQLIKRHSWWKDPVVQQIVANVELDSVYPTLTTPELPAWHKPGVVLIGDAAHTLPPTSGQGTSQALEDSQILAMLLAYYLERCHTAAPQAGSLASSEYSKAIDLASEKYFEFRKPRVKRIADRAKQMGDTKRKKGILLEWLTYFIIWLMGKLPVDDGTRWLYNDLPITAVRRFIDAEKNRGPDA